MQHHGPNCLTGPVRGTRGWWQELARDLKIAAASNSSPGSRPSRSSERPIRPDLVARVRREIAAGTYDTPEKWQAALDRLLDRLDL